ncbi:MAG: hypothetical protein QOH72_1113 [Solirubrobacteraceae bacterium]|jgi:hypothetical protein|nr:hypothetical protein [Solirubrobacteraceae bacterium]
MHRFPSHATASLRIPAEADLTIRPARYRDADALARLAELDSTRPLGGGHVVVAEMEGRIVAAVSVHDGRAIADPFVPAADIVARLRLHASASRPARAKVRIPRPWMPRLVLRGVATTAA